MKTNIEPILAYFDHFDKIFNIIVKQGLKNRNARFWTNNVKFSVYNVSTCTIYMITIYIWLTQKWLMRQSMCTHVAHTWFSKKQFSVKTIFSCGNHVCRLGAHNLSHYTVLRGWDMVLYHCKMASSYVEWKWKITDVKISARKRERIFHAFHVEKSEILEKLFFALEMPGKYFCSLTSQIFEVLGTLIFSHNFGSTLNFLTHPNLHYTLGYILCDI